MNCYLHVVMANNGAFDHQGEFFENNLDKFLTNFLLIDTLY